MGAYFLFFCCYRKVSASIPAVPYSVLRFCPLRVPIVGTGSMIDTVWDFWACEKAPSKQDKNLRTSAPSSHGLFFGCAFVPLPGVADGSELTSDHSMRWPLFVYMPLWKKHVSALCGLSCDWNSGDSSEYKLPDALNKAGDCMRLQSTLFSGPCSPRPPVGAVTTHELCNWCPLLKM